SGVNKPFDWTINPYRGCEFGCKYCYARFTHEFMEFHDAEQFERVIYAKNWNPSEFARELRNTPRGQPICIGTATDPYQPAERRFFLTRQMLAVIAQERGHKIWVTTKSDLIARDADILAYIARRNEVHVSMTITTADTALARLVEPYAPRPDLRLKAITALNNAGIPVRTLASPVMPLINDSEPALMHLAKSAKAAGARFFSGQPLFLKSCAQAMFFPFLEEHFPHLVRKYRDRYNEAAYLKGEYPKLIAERIAKIRKEVGFEINLPPAADVDWREPQLNLFDQTPDQTAESASECLVKQSRL
ncbi:MAG TPA: radical SAM protein, partial [Bryobacteraceae bacterium]|nr:radical SAM protein [Bryobacteraceae bacterium]